MILLVIDARELGEAESHRRRLGRGAAEEAAAEHAGAGRGHAEEGAATGEAGGDDVLDGGGGGGAGAVGDGWSELVVSRSVGHRGLPVRMVCDWLKAVATEERSRVETGTLRSGHC